MTLDYTTAKALADAGFEVKSNRQGRLIDKYGDGVLPYPIPKPIADSLEYVYIPTLSELIQELGENFEELDRSRNRLTNEVLFKAFGMVADELNPNVHGYGLTPELACSNLYLSIHKK